MTFRIHHFYGYYPQTAHQSQRRRTQDEWDAFMFCKAVKEVARRVFGGYIARVIKASYWPDAFIVPVPSKDSFDNLAFRSLTLLQASLPGDLKKLRPVAKFSADLPRAHMGGPRGYNHVYPNLTVPKVMATPDVILVDDILTKGGTLLATRRRLIEAGYNVRLAVVCGRTTWDSISVFQNGFEDVADNATEMEMLRA